VATTTRRRRRRNLTLHYLPLFAPRPNLRRRRRTAKKNLISLHDLPVFTPRPRAWSKRTTTEINLILFDLALFAPSPHTRCRLLLLLLLLRSLQRGALAEARRTLSRSSSSSSTALELDALGRVPAAVSAVEVVLLDGRAGPGARVRRAGPLVAVGQLVDVAVQVDATAVEALAVLLAGTPLAVIVVGLIGTARGPAVVVAIVTVVAVVSVPLAIAVAVAVPVAVTVSLTVSLPITVAMLTVAVVTAVAVSLPVTVTIMVAIPLPVSVAVADGGGAALREQDVGRAGLAVVTLTFGHGMAALGLIRVVLGAAAPHGTGTAAMRALTSVTMAVGAVTAALALLLGLVILLLEAADVLLKGAPSGVVGADGLEGGHMSKSAPNLLVSVIDADGGLHPLHVRAEVL
jgi:hypothetical protein